VIKQVYTMYKGWDWGVYSITHIVFSIPNKLRKILGFHSSGFPCYLPQDGSLFGLCFNPDHRGEIFKNIS
jgi:hypothetical protein